jgi:Flp pilus assembly protein CpaB
MMGSGSAPAPSRAGEPRDPPWGRTRWGRPRRGPVSRRRRWRQSQVLRFVAAALVGVAAWLTVGAVTPQPTDPGLPTVVAGRDLALGSTVTADDLRVERRPEAQRPPGALADPGAVVGQVVSGPVLAGEMVTPPRFRGASQLVGLAPGLVAVSLPVTDPVLLTTLRPADTVSVLATGSGQPLATAVRVLATDLPDTGVLAAGGAGPGHLLVAVTADEARNLAVALGPQGAAAGFLVAVRG